LVIVTGGASGMGAATAELLRALGAEVAILDRNAELADDVALRSGAHAYCTDIGDETAVVRAYEAIDRELGPIHGLFSNAGIILPEQPLHEERTGTWDEVIRVNLRGTFLAVREAVKRFVAQGSPGAIVCTSSCVARQAIPGGTNAYTASKGAIEAFVRQVAVDYAALRIRINAVAPGAVETPLMWGNIPPESIAEMRKVIDRDVPQGRIGQPMDVAHAVAWLLSDEASYVNGTSIVVDGGVGARSVLSA
jgi:NAD(P)-dependent dehydrogenase (short-subunit alcohol dehydrogenase family)